MGIVPLHLWFPATAQHSTPHLALVTCLTPLGSFMLARLALAIFPRVLGPAAPLLMAVGVFTALYGAFLAVGQFDLRRIVAWFWVSQSGLVLAGFAGLDDASVSGALLQAMSTVVECGGLMLLTLAVEVRANTTDLRKLGGLAHNAPRMATAYLILAAAAVGFPGTISFVAEDLVGQGCCASTRSWWGCSSSSPRSTGSRCGGRSSARSSGRRRRTRTTCAGSKTCAAGSRTRSGG
ncbi:proton-conducting transporter membrane subunit [Nannocystis pusilla]|uniref:proton-conducting transporter transmembrane domain-containing protein n=1 Tax=Nannocystis pusilla TaxID=889268 RepID=UPI003B7E143D